MKTIMPKGHKRTYNKLSIQVMQLQQQTHLLAASEVTTSLGGAPTLSGNAATNTFYRLQ